MFFYIETIFRDPDHQQLIKIALEGISHFLVHHFSLVKNFLHVCSLIFFLGMGNIPEDIWSTQLSISKGSPPLPPSPAPRPLLELQKCAATVGTPPRLIITHFIQTFQKIEVKVPIFFSLKVKNLIPRNWVCQRSKTIAVEGMIFAFCFSKKYDISLLFLSNVWYQIGVGHSTDLPVSMSASDRYDNPIPTWFLAPTDCSIFQHS